MYMEFIEKEIKYQLSKADFYVLKKYLEKHYKKTSPQIHINYYLDSYRLFLKKNGVSARLRKYFNGKYEFTIKVKKSNTPNNVHIKKEYTTNIGSVLFEKIINEGHLDNHENLRQAIFKHLSNSELLEEKINVLGDLLTERTSYILENDIDEIILDKSQYMGIEDYEVEWETEKLEEANSKLIKIFNNLRIDPKKNIDSKTDRFVKEYLKK